MTPRTQILATGAVLFAMLAAPMTVSAQQILDPIRVTAEADRAEQRAAEAAASATTSSHFIKAARLYERAAAARPESDPRNAESLRKAATLHYYSGDLRRSAVLMERSAQRSASIGDVVNAANTFIDAAIVANELREGERAVALGDRARMLMNSPLLSDTQRSQLRGRIARWAEVASL